MYGSCTRCEAAEIFEFSRVSESVGIFCGPGEQRTSFCCRNGYRFARRNSHAHALNYYILIMSGSVTE